MKSRAVKLKLKKRRLGNPFLGSNVKACLMKCEALTSLYTGVSGSLVSSVTLIIHCENKLNVEGCGIIS